MLDVTGAKVANGTNIQMYAANGSAAQKWRLVPTASGFVFNANISNSSDISRKIVDYELSQVGIGDVKGNMSRSTQLVKLVGL